MKAKIGMITIGQSPRDDVVPNIMRFLGPGIEVLEAGALDGLSIEDIENMTPKNGDYMLVTRMRDGAQVTISKSHILSRMQECIDDLVEKGVDLIVILCTGEFPDFTSEKIVLRLDRLLDGVVRGILLHGTLAIVAPSKDQLPQMRKKWKSRDFKVIVESASPYVAQDEITKVARKLAKKNVDLVLLDCIGFNNEMKDRVKQISGKPTILARSILARIVKEIIE